jgi:hypothetical protein
MALFKFDKDFKWWGVAPNRKCKICKALSLWMFKAKETAIEIPEEAAAAAEAAGVGKRVNYEAMQQ